MSPSTVYDRTKKTGYMTGPNHRMRQAMDAMQPPPPAASASAEGGGPPNLRDSGGDPESCGECANFDGRDTCLKYDSPVSPNEVCDDFDPVDEGDEEEAGGEQAAGMSGIPNVSPLALQAR